MYSNSINNLIGAFKKLPSVGQRTAERFVFYLLKSGKLEVEEIRKSLEEVLKNTKSCKICWNFDDESPCSICRDSRRDESLICVVADLEDIPALEKTGEYRGMYHVLRGVIEAGDEIETLRKIKIKELFARLRPVSPPAGDSTSPHARGGARGGGSEGVGVKEIILALNPDLPGETTMMYLEKEIKKINPEITVTRLARGLPMGSDLQYADEITLGSALRNRISHKS